MSASTEELTIRQAGISGGFPESSGEPSHPIRRPVELWASGLVVTLLSPVLALRSKFVHKILFATVIFDIPLQLGTTFFHRPADADLGAFRGLSISATTLALVGLYA